MREDYFGAPSHLKRPIAPVSTGQDRCDSIVSHYKATVGSAPQHFGFSAPATPPPTEDPLSLRLAEELDYARRMLDAMGDALCADPAVVMRHGVSLQSVDIVGQMLGHIANVVRSSQPDATVQQIGMCDLKARLTRRALT